VRGRVRSQRHWFAGGLLVALAMSPRPPRAVSALKPRSQTLRRIEGRPGASLARSTNRWRIGPGFPAAATGAALQATAQLGDIA